jgi:hypothetical protein
MLTGSLAGAGLASGAFEANYFGSATAPAQEIAGRLRFTTLDGARAVAAFGARP